MADSRVVTLNHTAALSTLQQVQMALFPLFVLPPGRGFGTCQPAGRASLANLDECEYARIGKALRGMAEEFHAAFRQGGRKDSKAEKAGDKGKDGGKREK